MARLIWSRPALCDLEEFADLSGAIGALKDQSDEIRDWEEVRSALIGPN